MATHANAPDAGQTNTEEAENLRAVATNVPGKPSKAGHRPEPFAFELRLRGLHPWPLITPMLVAVNAAVYLLLASTAGGWLEINSDRLLAWGADYAPLTLRGQGWRVLSSLFLHADLAHLVFNACFLLLVGRLTERILGSLSYLGVYLFAGVGSSLVALGWFPTAVHVGASGAVFGVYGALLGCWLRGWRVVPVQILGRHVAVLLLLLSFSLLDQFLLREESLIAHLGGAVCGFAAGLLLGPSRQLRGRGRRAVRPAVFLLLGLGAGGLYYLAEWGARRPLELIAGLQKTLTRERELLVRFDDALARWDDGELTDGQMQQLLQKELIPEWRKMRQDYQLRLPEENGNPFFKERAGSREGGSVLASIRQLKLPAHGSLEPQQRATPLEVLHQFKVYSRARLDTWESLADALQRDSLTLNTMTDLIVVEMLREEFDEMINEGNPLRDWIEFSHEKRREERLERRR